MINSSFDRDGSCVGVRLENGTEISASKGVVTGLGLKVSFLDCMDPDALHPEFVKACQAFSYGSVSIARVHYALNELPDYNNGCGYERLCLSSHFWHYA